MVYAEPINDDADIDIVVNDTELENNTSYTWNTGENIVEITVTDGSAKKIYTVTVTKS